MAFSNNIWITRKSRINASERLNKNNFWSQIIVAYYSMCLIILTIIDIKDDNFNFETLSLILSILIFTISIFIVSMNFKERSLILKTSYVKMSKLYWDILKKEDNEECYEDLKNQYNTIIELTEEHSTYDYLQVLFAERNNEQYKNVNPKWTYFSYFELFWYKIKRFNLIVFFFIIPPILWLLMAL